MSEISPSNRASGHRSLHARSRKTYLVWFIASLAWGIPVAGVPCVSVAQESSSEVKFLLFTDPPIENPIPVERATTNQLSLPLTAQSFGSMDAAEQQHLISDLIDKLEELEFYGDVQSISDSLLPEEYIAPLMTEAAAAAPLSIRRQRLISVLLHCPLQSQDGQSLAEEVWNLGKDDPLIRPLIESRLIAWNNGAALSDWRTILQQPNSPVNRVAKALDGLAAVGEATDIPIAKLWLAPNQSSFVQLAAASALARLDADGNRSLATEYLGAANRRRSHQDANIAARLLANDNSVEAGQTLVQILESELVGAHQTAFDVIANQHSELALSLAYQWVEQGNPNVRSRCVDILANSTDSKRFLALFAALDDAHPEIRTRARRILLESAEQPDLRQSISIAFARKLQDPSWRVIEQAILATVELKPTSTARSNAISRYVQLIRHPVASVNVTAAWAIKEVANQQDTIGQQKVIDMVHSFVAARVRRRERDSTAIFSRDEEKLYGQLIEALGRNRNLESDDMLRKFYPRSAGYGPLVRSTSLWALGRMHEHDAPNDLKAQVRVQTQALDQRLPDNPLVVFAACLAAGQFGDRQAIDGLKLVSGIENERVPVGKAALWAILQIEDDSVLPGSDLIIQRPAP